MPRRLAPWLPRRPEGWPPDKAAAGSRVEYMVTRSSPWSSDVPNLLTTTFSTAARIGEATGLLWGDLHLVPGEGTASVTGTACWARGAGTVRQPPRRPAVRGDVAARSRCAAEQGRRPRTRDPHSHLRRVGPASGYPGASTTERRRTRDAVQSEPTTSAAY